MQKPPISLDNLNQEEKDQLANMGYAKLKVAIAICLPLFLLFGYTVFYINNHYMGLGLENADLRSGLNIALVILTILPARLLVGEFMKYRKATNAWQKKIFRGPVQSISGKNVTVVNQRIKVPAELLTDIKVGDAIEIATAGGELVLYIKKMTSES